MCGYFCIVYIDFMRKDKNFLDYNNLFSTSKSEKNDKIILEQFHQRETKNLFYEQILNVVINVAEENKSQEFRLKKIKETRNFL